MKFASLPEVIYNAPYGVAKNIQRSSFYDTYFEDCQNTAHPSTYLLSSSVIVFALDFGLNIPS